MQRGKFITIEGTEGAGKSTALQFIHDYLAKTAQPFIITREPGGTPYAEDIRRLLLKRGDERVLPETELLLMFASRIQHLHHLIEPALAAGKWVVSDRYVDASYAYQGGGRGIDSLHIKNLDQWLVNYVYPDLTLLLDVPPAVGHARTQQRGDPDRIEQEKLDFFERVRQAYLDRARQEPLRIKMIDANKPLPAVQAQLKQTLDVFWQAAQP